MAFAAASAGGAGDGDGLDIGGINSKAVMRRRLHMTSACYRPTENRRCNLLMKLEGRGASYLEPPSEH